MPTTHKTNLPAGQHPLSRLTPSDLIAPINAAHDEFVASAKKAIQSAIEAGRLLNAAKAQVKHGDWRDWIKANCQFSERMAQYYMTLAKNETCFALEKPQSIRQALALLAKPPVKPEVIDQLEAHDPDLARKAELHQLNPKRAKSQMRREQRQAEDEKTLAARAVDPGPEWPQLIHGRFQDADVADASIDWVVTDPPYGLEYLQTYQEFSSWAARKLRPGGSALVMIGQSAFDQTWPALWSELDRVWPLTVVLMPKNAPRGRIWSPAAISCGSKSILWLARGTPTMHTVVEDVYTIQYDENTKDDHPWQQSQALFDELIQVFTQVGHVVCDPMMGSGTTGLACVTQHRNFIGIEKDLDTYQGARVKILACEAKGRDRTPDLHKAS